MFMLNHLQHPRWDWRVTMTRKSGFPAGYSFVQNLNPLIQVYHIFQSVSSLGQIFFKSVNSRNLAMAFKSTLVSRFLGQLLGRTPYGNLLPVLLTVLNQFGSCLFIFYHLYYKYTTFPGPCQVRRAFSCLPNTDQAIT